MHPTVPCESNQITKNKQAIEMASSASSSPGAKTSPIPEGTQVSLMIPWLESWVTEGKVFHEFRSLGWGWVLKVDMVKVDAGKRPHQKAFIHLKDWKDEHLHYLEFLSQDPIKEAIGDRFRMKYPEVKVFYKKDADYYWKVRMSTWKPREESVSGTTSGGRKPEMVNFGGGAPAPKGLSAKAEEYRPVSPANQFSVLDVEPLEDSDAGYNLE